MGWEDLVSATVGCYVAFWAARVAADYEPVTWSLFAGMSLVVGFAFMFVSNAHLSRGYAAVALIAFVSALVAGAFNGSAKKRRRAISTRVVDRGPTTSI
jgi:hypothetical protein